MIGFDATVGVQTMVSLETSTLGRDEIGMEYIAILQYLGWEKTSRDCLQSL